MLYYIYNKYIIVYTCSLCLRVEKRTSVLQVFLKSSYDIVGWGGVITYMLRCCKFSCTFIYTSCYAAASSLALPYIPTCYAAASSLVLSYICHATLLQVLLHFPTYVMLRCCKFCCTSIHTDMLRKQKESSTCEEQRVEKK